MIGLVGASSGIPAGQLLQRTPSGAIYFLARVILEPEVNSRACINDRACDFWSTFWHPIEDVEQSKCGL